MDGWCLIFILLIFVDTISTQFVGIREYSKESPISIPIVGRGYEGNKFLQHTEHFALEESSIDQKLNGGNQENIAVDDMSPKKNKIGDDLTEHIHNDPETINEFSELMEKLVPGTKDVQAPLVQTLENIWPILKEDPDIIKNMMPTLHEIIKSVAKKENISKSKFARWGKSLLKSGGPHLKKWMKAIKESPIQELTGKIELLNLDELEDYLEEYQLKTFNDVVDWSQQLIGWMIDLAGFEKPKSAQGWFTGIFDIIRNDDDNNGDDINTSIFDEAANFLFMNDYEILKKLMPKSNDELFELMDKLLPGMKNLQQPLVKTLRNMWPIIKKDPDIIKKQMDTWKEIIDAVLKDKKITDAEYAKWGRSLLKLSGPQIINGIKAIKESPVKELIEKIEFLEFENIEELLEEHQQEGFKEVVAFCHAMLMLMADLGDIKTETNYMGWIQGIMNKIG